MKVFNLLTICLLIFINLSFLQADDVSLLNLQHEKVIIDVINDAKKFKINKLNATQEWIWIQLNYYDEKYPLTIDIVKKSYQKIDKLVFLIAPTGLNFQNTFLTPLDRNIAKFMTKQKNCVIGITFRENNLPIAETGDFVNTWGIAKHREDIRKVVELFNRHLKLPYDMLGQASSAVTILDYASVYSDNLEKIILLDTDSFDPSSQSEKIVYANMCYSALNQLIASGVTVDPFLDNLKQLIYASVLYPDYDSGQSRDFMGLPGNFTYNGLLHFSLIYTAILPGIHTPITNLPGEWVMIKGAAAGLYLPDADPLLDQYSLTHTGLTDLVSVAAQSGSGLTPLAFNRDVYALLGQNGFYTINWSGIEEQAVFVNTMYSSGNQTYYATCIRNAGNPDVSVNIVPDYAYIDSLYGKNAETDVWKLFQE